MFDLISSQETDRQATGFVRVLKTEAQRSHYIDIASTTALVIAGLLDKLVEDKSTLLELNISLQAQVDFLTAKAQKLEGTVRELSKRVAVQEPRKTGVEVKNG